MATADHVCPCAGHFFGHTGHTGDVCRARPYVVGRGHTAHALLETRVGGRGVPPLGRAGQVPEPAVPPTRSVGADEALEQGEQRVKAGAIGALDAEKDRNVANRFESHWVRDPLGAVGALEEAS